MGGGGDQRAQDCGAATGDRAAAILTSDSSTVIGICHPKNHFLHESPYFVGFFCALPVFAVAYAFDSPVTHGLSREYCDTCPRPRWPIHRADKYAA